MVLTWSFIENDSHEYLKLVGYSCIPNLRNIWITTAGCRDGGGKGRRDARTEKRTERQENAERERKRKELDLIDKVDLSATRGRVYVHLVSFFRSRPLTAILDPQEPFVFSTTRHYPRRKRPCIPRASVYVSRRFSFFVFSYLLPSIFVFPFLWKNADGT